MIELLSSLVLVAGLGFLLGYRFGYRRGDVAGLAKSGCKICFERGEEKGRKDVTATMDSIGVVTLTNTATPYTVTGWSEKTGKKLKAKKKKKSTKHKANK